MKRLMSTKHTRGNSTRMKDLKKPFGFCCDVCEQDPQSQYDMRNPPFESAFTDIPMVTSRPDVQLRIQDSGKRRVPVQRTVGVYSENTEVKKASTYGRSRKGRGPLTWFLEDEIEAARNLLAEEKKTRWEEMHEKKMIKSKTQRKSDKINIRNDKSHSSTMSTAQPELGAGNNEKNQH